MKLSNLGFFFKILNVSLHQFKCYVDGLHVHHSEDPYYFLCWSSPSVRLPELFVLHLSAPHPNDAMPFFDGTAN